MTDEQQTTEQTVEATQPEQTKRLGRPPTGVARMILDSYSIEPSLFDKLHAAIGIILDDDGKQLSKAGIIREGIKLILAKHGCI